MTPEKKELLLRYHEIATKGDNRAWFEERLGINTRKLIQRAHPDGEKPEIKRIHGRILVTTDWNLQIEEALRQRLFGLSSFSPIRRVPTDLEELRKKALEYFQEAVEKTGLPKSFRVRTRRSDKALSQTSTELDRMIGTEIRERYPELKVDLDGADFTLGIEIRFENSFIWAEKIPGPGGLPVGCNAPVLSLISGGLDSPVASIQILKRGSPVSFVHFYGTPFVGEEVLDKISKLVQIVNRYQPEPRPLCIVPFGKIQEKIALVAHPKMRTLLYRRMMIRIANALGKNLGVKALVTGESLGQVASQTVENLGVIDSVTELPILRPLIGLDKDEIIAKAQAWGSFETSILPATDCCTLFADRHPILRCEPNQIQEQELKFSVNDLVQEAVAGMVIKNGLGKAEAPPNRSTTQSTGMT